jgi:hypothetical protein
VCEFLGGVGLIVPAMTGVKPRLTLFAAFGLALVMILAAVFHIVWGEYNFVPSPQEETAGCDPAPAACRPSSR